MERILLIRGIGFTLTISVAIAESPADQKGNTMNIKTLVASLLLMLGLATGSAQATLLQGKIVTVEYFYPNLSSVFDTGSNGNYLVGDDVEIGDLYFGLISLDVSDSKTSINFFGDSWFFGDDFNGIQISVAPGAVDDFVSVTIDSASTWNTFEADRISFGDDYIRINWQGLSFSSNDSLVLNISATPQAVPEPASLMLLSLALLGFATVRRKA
jgi:hypothetical protein